MYIVLVVFTGLLAAFWGWNKGLFHAVLRLAVIVAAYVLAWQKTPAFAAYLMKTIGLSALAAWPVAAALLFFGGGIVFSVVARIAAAFAVEHWNIGKRRWSGALFGALLGGGLGLLLVWTVGTLQDSWRLRQPPSELAAPTTSTPASIFDDELRKLSGDMMAVFAGQALGNSAAAPAAQAWVRHPVSLGQELQYLAQKPELQQLFQNPDNYAVLVRDPVSAVAQLPEFRALVADERAMQFLVLMGLQGKDAAQQSATLASTLKRYAGNYERLRAEPEFQALMADAGLRESLQQGNLLGLLANAKVRQMAELLARDPAQSDAASVTQPEVGSPSQAVAPVDSADQKAEPVKPLYRWKDEKGRLHVTDQKPPEGVEADVIQPE